MRTLLLWLIILFFIACKKEASNEQIVYCQDVYSPYKKDIELIILDSLKSVIQSGFLEYEIIFDKNMKFVEIKGKSDVVDSSVYTRLYPFIKTLKFKQTKANKEKLINSTINPPNSLKLDSDTSTQWRNIPIELCTYHRAYIHIMLFEGGKKYISFPYAEVYEVPYPFE